MVMNGEPGASGEQVGTSGSRQGEGATMALKRAIAFRSGSVGLTCAAFEVTIERGTEIKAGVIRGVTDCPEPATEIEEQTAFCAKHAQWYRRSKTVSVIEVQHKDN